MATYVPNATDFTEPLESQTVESAALEFRTLKGRTNTLEATVASNLVTLQAADAADTADRIDADRNIIDSFAPILDGSVAANFTNYDLGFVIDDVPAGSTFDFGTLF